MSKGRNMVWGVYAVLMSLASVVGAWHLPQVAASEIALGRGLVVSTLGSDDYCSPLGTFLASQGVARECEDDHPCQLIPQAINEGDCW